MNIILDTPGIINISNSWAYEISGTCSENGDEISVTVWGSDVTPVPTPLCSSGVLDFTVDTSSVVDSSAVEVIVTISDDENTFTDLTSSWSTSKDTLSKDTLILPPTLDSPTNFSPLTGTWEIGLVIKIFNTSNIVIWSWSVDENGDFNITPSPIPSSGPINITATDSAGNESWVTTITTEDIDIAAPMTVSGSLDVVIDSTQATILWETDEPTSSEIIYGLTTTDTTTWELNVSPRVTSHSLTLTGLLSCTTYYYQTISRDAAWNEMVDGTYTLSTSGCVGDTVVTQESSSDIIPNNIGWDLQLNDDIWQNFVDIRIPVWYNTSHPICPSWTYFQLKKLEKSPVQEALWNPTIDKRMIRIYELSAYCSENTRVTSFDAPITVTMTYDIKDMANTREDSLAIYRYDTDDNSWKELENCEVNTSNTTIICETSSFSTFWIFGSTVGWWVGTPGWTWNYEIIQENDTEENLSIENWSVNVADEEINWENEDSSTDNNIQEIDWEKGVKITYSQELWMINSDVLEINRDLIDVNLERGYDLERIQELKRTLGGLWIYSWNINGYYTDDLVDAVYQLQLSLGVVTNQYQVWAWSWWPATRKVFFKAYPNYEYSVFRPDDVISKSEAVKILMRISDIQALDPQDLSYTDITTSWHVPYVVSGQTLGLFDVTQDAWKFNPDNGVQRSEMVDLIHRLIQLY